MKLTSFKDDFAFGQVVSSRPASQEDMLEGIDIWVGGIPFAWRRYRFSIQQYGEISIRYSRPSGSLTEYNKLLNGSFKAQLYVFQWTDAVIVCLVDDIIACLKAQRYTQKPNKDGTSAVYIKLEAIKHLLLRQ